ncbi:MAG: M15 family metallopeptidase [Patescibacteria group bacterium]
MEKYTLNFLASLTILSLALIIFVPYFTTDFLDLRQKKENEENYQKLLKEREAQKKAIKEAQVKIYLTGKFDPSLREDFTMVSAKYNISGYKMYLRKETLNAFEDMAEIAEKNDLELNITSATRNFDYQKDLWNKKWEGVTLVDGKDLTKSIPDELERFEKILEYSAVPGASRHHWGTDIDINGVTPVYFDSEEGEKVYEWLTKNAPLFGFCQIYSQKGENRQTGYNEEKWHWSYLPLSKNFTQEYKNLIKNEDIKGFDGDEYVFREDLINNYVLSINPNCI